MSAAIPFLDLPRQIAADAAAIERAWKRVLRGGRWILGPEVAAFEKECAALLGAPSVGVNSGTDALVLALRALGIGAGDQVLVPAFTFAASAGAILLAGAEPVICDIEEGGYNLDPAEIVKRAGKRAKAVMVVHMYGEPADMKAVLAAARKKKLKVVEDTAQAIGARTPLGACGAIGDAGGISFYPTKNLGAIGDGGLLVCKKEALAQKARALRNHGQTQPYHSTMLGMNSRLDEVQAAALRIKLKRLAAWNKARAAQAKRYNQAFAGLPVGVPAWTGRCVWHQYTLRVPGGKRDALRKHLAKRGIANAVYYPIPLHKQKAFAPKSRLSLPRAEAASRQALSLPVFPELGPARQSKVIAAVREFFKGGRAR